MPESVEAVRSILDVSRESAERLSIYVDLLRRWQKRINLVSGKTVENLWTRHVADSAQALAATPHAKRWMDLGSGAGFPGIVTAILLAETPGANVDLVESDQRKASFLRTVSRETGIPATVHVARIEDVVADWDAPVDAVSARALASLSELCGFAAPLVVQGAVAVFHKGRDFSRELEEANRFWIIDLVEKASSIEPDSRIVVIRHLQRR
ncbi:16S rRNA (guanine(527)-N(7))-methyltransferase RsmG [Rhodobium orientis]|uniref:Ribosomal RNA small subunit methyltransferase G n=1 Tax=Rhodobium orientis TaxID=34017 RepID=A0A327JQV5_9HYPH|nr:16S rRNA (guanine(527)-N(7))-methyltransferase RsmG [Rhodobium orientis]MBK5948226.1 16S rRNA (guanine(527)-N(7))-methyltransferase RsmG [Rhodobium orientis]RAI28859.1 16S rRNA (guanine(527)-N(7))-methyltransferase RsmG [Rhodobium orientis]